MEEGIKLNHSIIVENRKKFTLSGIREVFSFDEESIMLKTDMGKLAIKGENLKIVNFNTDSGDLLGEGKLYAMAYVTEEKNTGLFSRLFR